MQKWVINFRKNATNHFLLLKKFKNTESAQLCSFDEVFSSELGTCGFLMERSSFIFKKKWRKFQLGCIIYWSSILNIAFKKCVSHIYFLKKQPLPPFSEEFQRGILGKKPCIPRSNFKKLQPERRLVVNNKWFFTFFVKVFDIL